MCIGVYLSVPASCRVGCLRRQEEGVRSPEAGGETAPFRSSVKAEKQTVEKMEESVCPRLNHKSAKCMISTNSLLLLDLNILILRWKS